MVALETLPLLLLGRWILINWAGKQNADLSGHILPLLAVGSALAALSVTGNYAMLALGRARTPTLITAGTGCLMLVTAGPAMTKWGIEGIAVERIFMGAASLLVYIPLWRALSADHDRVTTVVMATSAPGGVPQ
jgi:O-antigen/teichoic acid export membrane protein